jgi:hypothetical protein
MRNISPGIQKQVYSGGSYPHEGRTRSPHAARSLAATPTRARREDDGSGGGGGDASLSDGGKGGRQNGGGKAGIPRLVVSHLSDPSDLSTRLAGTFSFK